jgi:hypothetical protein
MCTFIVNIDCKAQLIPTRYAEGARASAREVLDSISRESDTYVATPPDRSNEV